MIHSLLNDSCVLVDQSNGIDLSKLLAPAEDYLDGDEEEDDPEAKEDPLNTLDLKQYLLTFLRYASWSVVDKDGSARFFVELLD
jgi:hypothetical protein